MGEVFCFSAKGQIDNLKTLRTIGNVAKYGGAATSVISSTLSIVKIAEQKSVSASDILNFTATGVAVTAFIVSAPVSVTALAITGATLGAIQLLGGTALDDIEIFNFK